MHGKLFTSFTDEPFDVLIGNILNLALVVDCQQCHVSIVADQYCQRQDTSTSTFAFALEAMGMRILRTPPPRSLPSRGFL